MVYIMNVLQGIYMSRLLSDKMGPYLYHYSTVLFDEIESLAKQKNISKKQLEKDYKEEVIEYCNPNVYSKNISLFIDPIPVKTIASIFNHKHKVWISGKEFYQYTVDYNDIPEDIEYNVVETPLQNKMLDDTVYDWPKDPDSKEFDSYLKQFKCKKLQMMKRNGEVGTGRDNLFKVISPYRGQIESYYRDASKLISNQVDPDAKKSLYEKYAQSVPHIMIYPESGEIKYSSVKKVKIA